MEILGELLKMLLPSVFILYGVYLMLRHQVSQERSRLEVSRQQALGKESIALRLQAYERLCLLLERTSPQQLLPRVLEANMNAKVFQSRLLSEIRNELNHNLSQQVYMSKALWQQTRAAIEETILLINEAAAEAETNANAQQLAKRILEAAAQKRFDSIENALDMIRDEIKLLF